MSKRYSNFFYLITLIILLRTGESHGLNGVNKLEDVESSLFKKNELNSGQRLIREREKSIFISKSDSNSSIISNSTDSLLSEEMNMLEIERNETDEKIYSKGRLKAKGPTHNEIDWKIKRVVDVQNIYSEENSIPFLMFQFVSSAKSYFGQFKEFIQKKVTVNTEKPGIRAFWLLIIVCFLIFFCCVGLQVILNLAKKAKLNLNNMKQELEYEVGDQEINQNPYRYQQTSFPK